MRVCQVGDGVMLHRMGQSRNLPIHHNFLVHRVVAEAPGLSTEKPEHQVGRPAAMADDVPTKAGSSWYFEAIIASWVGDSGSDFCSEGWLDPLVGIKRKDPIPCRRGQGTVFLRAETGPIEGNQDLGPESTGDVPGLIGAVVVEDDDFVGKMYRAKATCNARFLIAADYDD